MLSSCDLGTKPAPEKPKAEARGREVQEQREIPSFQGIVVSNRTAVTVKPGKSTQAKLSGPENYLKALTIRPEKRRVNGKEIEVLVIALDKRIELPPLEVEIETPALIYVEAGGPARVKVGDFTGPHLTLRADRAAKLELAPGAYAKLDVETKLAARILGPAVAVETAHLSASGVSQIQLGQVASLKKTTQGDARIVYQGEPDLLP